MSFLFYVYISDICFHYMFIIHYLFFFIYLKSGFLHIGDIMQNVEACALNSSLGIVSLLEM